MIFQMLARLKEGREGRRSTETLRDIYTAFLTQLSSLSIGHLASGQASERHQSALVLVELLLDAFGVDDPGLAPLKTLSTATTLLDMLSDGFVRIRDSSLALLLRLFESDRLLSVLSFTWENVLADSSSLAPGDTEVASYRAVVLLHCKVTKGLLNNPSEHSSANLIFEALKTIGLILESQVTTCDHIDQHTPTYGKLLLCRRLLVDLRRVCPDRLKAARLVKPFAAIVLRLMTIIREKTADILENPSPEGYVYAKAHSSQNESLGYVAQAQLLCAWRTSKELSLLLADLSAMLVDHEDAPFSSQELHRILAFLSSVLESTVHRGAFEQAHAGLAGVCNALFRSTNPSLSSMPNQLLQIVLQKVIYLVIQEGSLIFLTKSKQVDTEIGDTT